MTMMDRERKYDDEGNSDKDYSWGGTIKPHEKWAEMPKVADEAAEWPGPVDSTELNDGETFLTIEQEQRASALHQARVVLERRGGSGLTGSGPLPSSMPPNCADLLRVANFILTGEQ